MHILAAKQLAKVYGHRTNLVQALNNISFSVDAGEFVGIMGPSGAGKSTLLNVLASIDQPTSGQVFVKNVDLNQLNTVELAKFRRQELGFIFQSFNLLGTLSVRENIILPLTLAKMPVPLINERLEHVSKILGLTALLERFPGEISIGQQQRVACARAIITHPAILLADEPTGSLDSKAATEFLQYLADLNLAENTTILMVTHDAFTASYCNRILFIKDGAIFSEVVRQGDRKTFFNHIIEMQATIGGGGRMNAHSDGR